MRYYAFPRDRLIQIAKQCETDSDKLTASDAAKWTEAHNGGTNNPYRAQRDARVEVCIKADGWCSMSDDRPAVSNQPCLRRVIRLPGRYIVGDTPTNLESSVTIELLGQSKRQSITSQDNGDKTIFMPVAAVRYFKVAASLAIAEIEMPDLRRTLLNCSSVSLSRLRRILTCTLSLKFNELRKWVGFDLFMIFLLLGGMA